MKPFDRIERDTVPNTIVSIDLTDESSDSISREEQLQSEQEDLENYLTSCNLRGEGTSCSLDERKGRQDRKRKRMQEIQTHSILEDQSGSEGYNDTLCCGLTGHENRKGDYHTHNQDRYGGNLNEHDIFDVRKQRVWPYDPKVKEYELVRILIQSLRDMGYETSAKTLETESNCFLEDVTVTKFRQSILEGDWEMVEKSFKSLEFNGPNDKKEAQRLIVEQKYLELLEEGNIDKALLVLRHELASLVNVSTELHRLTSYLMYTSNENLKEDAKWNGSSLESRKRLLADIQKYISPSQMLAEKRLETLLHQAIEFQRLKCVYHNVNDESISLYENHTCQKEQLSMETLFSLEGHQDEVWYVQFSHNGHYLASASKDTSVIVWDVETRDIVHTLIGHKEPVSFLSWSPDDTMILTCGSDKKLKLWDMDSGSCRRTFSRHSETVLACAWLPDNERFVSGGLDKNIFLWNIEGASLYRWYGARVTDLGVTADGKKMVAICHERKIHIYDLENDMHENFIQETDSVTSLCLADDQKHALVNLSCNEIHLWNLEEKRLVKRYTGHSQIRYIIRSCFGGSNQSFIISGSEDSNIYIWHREHGNLITVLQGHYGMVNCVNWNSKNPHMFASASDDRSIRVWSCPRSH